MEPENDELYGDIDVNHTLASFSTINIVYIPIGEGDVQEYIDILCSFKSFELRQIAPSFVQLPRDSTEAFRHIEPQQLLLVNYERHPIVPSKWESIRVSKRVMVVIGLCHAPQNEEIMKAYSDFMDARKSYPSAVLSKMFAFEPLSAHVEADAEVADDLILIPNISPDDKGKLNFYVESLLLDICNSLLKHFGEWVNNSFALPIGSITTPLDERSADDSAPQSKQKQKKKHSGRVSKIAGDYSMLAASHVDAMKHYTEAIELSKATNDTLWHAASIEGHCATLEQGGEIGPQIVISAMNEALQLYIKCDAVALAVECAFSLLCIQIQHGLVVEASKMLNEVYTLASTLSVREQMTVASKIFIICDNISHRRKQTYFLKKFSLLCEENEYMEATWRVLLLICRNLGIDFGCSLATGIDEEEDDGWTSLRKKLVLDLIDVSKRLRLDFYTVKYYAYMLRKFRTDLSRDEQLDIASQIVALSSSISSTVTLDLGDEMSICMCHVPDLVEMRAERMRNDLIPHSWDEKKPKDDDTDDEDLAMFIYTPISKSRRSRRDNIRPTRNEDVSWVCNEMGCVSVLLENKTLINLEMKNLSLWTDDEFPFASYPITVTVPAESTSRVCLKGKAWKEGDLKITGVKASVLDVPYIHPLRPGYEILISVAPPLPRLVASGSDVKRVSLYAGETRMVEIEFRNESNDDIGYVEIESNLEELNGALAYEFLDMGPKLPIKAGSTSFLSLSLTSKLTGSNTLEFSVKYASSEENTHYRVLKHRFNVFTKPSVVLDSISMSPFCRMHSFFDSRGSSILGDFFCDTSQALCKIDLSNVGDAIFTISSSVSGLHELDLVPDGELNVIESEKDVSLVVHPGSGLRLLLLMSRIPEHLIQEGMSHSEKISTCMAYVLSKVKLNWQTPTNVRGIVAVDELSIDASKFLSLFPERANVNLRIYTRGAEAGVPGASKRTNGSMRKVSLSHSYYTRSIVFSNLQSTRCYAPTDGLVTIVVTVKNLVKQKNSYLVKIVPVGLRKHRSHDRFMWIGKLEKTMHDLAQGESHAFSFPVIFHERTVFSINFSVLEIDGDPELLATNNIDFCITQKEK